MSLVDNYQKKKKKSLNLNFYNRLNKMKKSKKAKTNIGIA